MGVTAKIGNELATPTQIAAQRIRFYQRSRIVGGDASWGGGSEGSEVLGEWAVVSDVPPAARVPQQRDRSDDTDGDPDGSSSGQCGQAPDRRTSGESYGSRREAREVREPSRRGSQ